tara:strand:+ start:51 stop:338 length:288 start_codon:yes stop_codon:yes gene_type:complete
LDSNKNNVSFKFLKKKSRYSVKILIKKKFSKLKIFFNNSLCKVKLIKTTTNKIRNCETKIKRISEAKICGKLISFKKLIIGTKNNNTEVKINVLL